MERGVMMSLYRSSLELKWSQNWKESNQGESRGGRRVDGSHEDEIRE